ncbi:hypothetical protein BOX15_Mlig002788g1 [Macrostomum lignano]|uniref:Phospholipid-transporting ATPase n=1 Tax=Macrostomum lignano TaxID=282301 RepID=A0A267ECE6_9PLAT|nr:hypothetical protein BOX15_Mlig002788g1 [Macrostomum lignano]
MASPLQTLWQLVKPKLLCESPRPELRTVYINHLNFELPGPDGKPSIGQSEKYPNNSVSTARYNIITFLPLNLLEQISRLPNLYFLVACIIQLSTDTPVSEMASILPLAFVILVTMVKQGYEDLLRHLEDRKVNKTLVWVVRDGESQLISSEQLRVGDLVKVFRNECFPCDLLLLSSSQHSGECLVTTANLDGETNLKTFWAVEATKSLRNAGLLCSELLGKVVCEQPKPDLYSFAGVLQLVKPQAHSSIPLNASNVLLRGAVLRNTNFAYGLALYTGSETKVGLNSRGSRAKRSVVDTRLNSFMLVLIGLLLLLTCVLVAGNLLIARSDAISKAWFLPGEQLKRPNFQETLNALIIMHYIIPISMLVTIEVQKFFCSMFIDHDLEMFHRMSDDDPSNWAKANTSEIIEELGVVDHLFCDKTGTLTENIMTFRGCSINGVKYSLKGSSLLASHNSKQQLGPAQQEFLTHLALCHTARAERSGNSGRLVYHASSPDEKALLDGCRKLGVTFRGRTGNQLTVGVGGRSLDYQLLHVLEFDSDRRRMSVVVSDPMGVLWLITKGADTAMLPRCISGSTEVTVKHVADFCAEGLRVLVVGRKRLTQVDANQIAAQLQAASASLADREAKLTKAADSVEKDLQLLGCTAVEDQLQAGVPECISDLRRAGIRVWILTGDKVETAENISLAAGHVTLGMRRLRIVGCRTREAVDSALTIAEAAAASSGPGVADYCIVVEGDSLQMLTDWDNDRDLCRRFLRLADESPAVLCCRCTPLQKSRTVAAVKLAADDSGRWPLITCAIGDGANDVSMIKEAHVGVGLYGKEGRAAALNSDYCMGRFRYLRKLLLFHGHLFYYRLSMLVQYFFYKNVAFTLPQFFYALHNGFNLISLYDSFFLAAYNAFLTAMPILVYGVFEQHLPRSRLYREPRLYAVGKAVEPLSWRRFFAWMLAAFWHSGVCFYGNAAVFWLNDDIGRPGISGFGLSALGTLVVECLLIVVHTKLIMCSRFFHTIVVFSFLLSVLCYPLLAAFYNSMYTNIFDENHSFYWLFFELHRQPAAWLMLATVPLLALAPDLAIAIWRRGPLDEEEIVDDEDIVSESAGTTVALGAGGSRTVRTGNNSGGRGAARVAMATA